MLFLVFLIICVCVALWNYRCSNSVAQVNVLLCLSDARSFNASSVCTQIVSGKEKTTTGHWYVYICNSSYIIHRINHRAEVSSSITLIYSLRHSIHFYWVHTSFRRMVIVNTMSLEMWFVAQSKIFPLRKNQNAFKAINHLNRFFFQRFAFK